jgi:integrase
MYGEPVTLKEGGCMTTRRRRDHGTGHIYRRGGVWWIQTRFHGKRHRESSHSTKKGDAVKLLKQRIAEQTDGTFNPRAQDVTFGELAAMLRTNYRINGRRSKRRAELSIRHLEDVFGQDKAVNITYDRLEKYIEYRADEGAAPASIQNELAALKFMFSLAVKARKLNQKPAFPTVKVTNARDVFFDDWEFAALKKELPDYLKGLAEFSYLTGWRINSELLGLDEGHQPLEWNQVHFQAGVVTLKVGTTKNDEGRTFPFDVLPELKGILGRQRGYSDHWSKITGKVVPLVFHRRGEPIKNFRRAWMSACKRADLGRKIPHDFRRTAVRNLERAGVPRSVAKKLVGHKTDSMYNRYAIANEKDLREGVQKLAELRQGKQDEAPRVLAIGGGGNHE